LPRATQEPCLGDVDTTGQDIEGMDFSDERLQEPADTKTRRVPRKKRRDTNGLIRVLKSLNIENLTDAEKADLRQKLRHHRKELKMVDKIVDRHLKKLATKKKRKVGKRKPA